MDRGDQTLEADIVEIDGRAVEAGKASSARGWSDWQGYGQKVMTLNPKWMPLWIVLGFVLLVIAVAVGMILAVLYGFYRILRGFVGMLGGPTLREPRTTIR